MSAHPEKAKTKANTNLNANLNLSLNANGIANTYSNTNVNTKIRTCLNILVLGFFASFVFYFITGKVFRMPHPMDGLFFNTDDIFADYLGILVSNKDWTPFKVNFRGFTANYPPGAYLVMLPFTNLIESFGYLYYIFAYAIAAFSVFYIYLRSYAKAATTQLPLPLISLAIIFGLMNYPSLFALERLNTENMLFILSTIYLLTRNTKYEKLGLLALSAATSAKIYPILFLIAENRNQVLKKGVLVALGALCFTGLAIYVFNTDITEIMAVYENSGKMTREYFMIGTEGFRYGNSLCGLIKGIMGIFTDGVFDKELSVLIFTYTPLIIAPAFLFSTYLYFKRDLLLWQRLFFAGFFILIWPSVSADYKLIHFLPAFAAFLVAAPCLYEKAISILFSLLLVPLGFYLLFADVTIAIILHPLIMITIWILVIKGILQTSKVAMTTTTDTTATGYPVSQASKS